MAYDKSKLFKSRLPEDEVDVPGVGVVRVRGLSRGEVVNATKAHGDDQVALGQEMLSLAIVAIDGEPVTFDFDEIVQWQNASPLGEMTPIEELVAKVSGMHPDSGKEVYREIATDTDVQFRVSPSGDTEHDDLPDSGDAE